MTGDILKGVEPIRIQNGTRLRASDDRVYVLHNVIPILLKVGPADNRTTEAVGFTSTFRREVPKLRGKALVKAAKRARQQARGAIAA